jgi:HAD superfamily hydrolase (TIGR01509 family)
MKMLRAYLLDLDGTLVANEPLKARAFAEACRHFGGQADPMLYGQVLGTNLAKATDIFTRHAGISPDHRDYHERYSATYQAYFDREAVLTPGAEDLIRHAKGNGIKLAVVSSASSRMVAGVLSRFGLSSAFDVLVTQEEVTSHKPDPEPYRLGLARLDIDPRDALAFEDSAPGLMAASAAGCACIAIRHAFNADHDFSRAQKVVQDFHGYLRDLPRP